MGHYEVQILDSFENPTYFDGQAGSIYKQTPPLANAMRKPGEWNYYDIVFTVPKFKGNGDIDQPGHVTLIQNGVLLLNHFELMGPTNFVEARTISHMPRLARSHCNSTGMLSDSATSGFAKSNQPSAIALAHRSISSRRKKNLNQKQLMKRKMLRSPPRKLKHRSNTLAKIVSQIKIIVRRTPLIPSLRDAEAASTCTSKNGKSCHLFL